MTTTTTLPSREETRALAVDILRRLEDRIPVPCDVMAATIVEALSLDPLHVGLIDTHLAESNGPKTPTHLRVVDYADERCLTLATWCGQDEFSFDEDVLGQTVFDAAETVTTSARRVRPNNILLRRVTTLLDDGDYQRVRDDAAQREWSLSHMLAAIVRAYYAQH